MLLRVLLASLLAVAAGCEPEPQVPPDVKPPPPAFEQAGLALLSGTLDQLELDPEQRKTAQQALVALAESTDQESYQLAMEGLRQALMPASNGVDIPACLAAAALAYVSCMALSGNHFVCSAIADGILLSWLGNELAAGSLTAAPAPGPWPPANNGGCELRAPDARHPTVWCENVSCGGTCTLNGMPGGSNNTYWYCTCQ